MEKRKTLGKTERIRIRNDTANLLDAICARENIESYDHCIFYISKFYLSQNSPNLAQGYINLPPNKDKHEKAKKA